MHMMLTQVIAYIIHTSLAYTHQYHLQKSCRCCNFALLEVAEHAADVAAVALWSAHTAACAVWIHRLTLQICSSAAWL
jgi:hypothetical protein